MTVPSEVIQRFVSKNAIPFDEAKAIFAELEIFLSANVASQAVPRVEVDEAWHEFILHTRLYAAYCDDKFGRFIHHVPGTPSSTDVGADGTARCSKCSANCVRL